MEWKMTRPYYPVSRYDRRQYRGQAAMLRLLAGMVLAILVTMALLASGKAQAQVGPPVARFDGGIGETPVSTVVAGGTVTANIVLGVSPGGQPWVIDRLTASATATNIRVDGRGLLL